MELPRSLRVAWVEIRESFDYSVLTPLKLRLPDFEADILATDYADKVSTRLRLPEEQLESIQAMFADLTAGQGELEKA